MVASSTSNVNNATAINADSTDGATRRLSFAKIHEPLDVPNLLALQTDSFDWLVGNERWQARVAKTLTSPEHPGTAIFWDDAIFEVVSAELQPQGAVRYGIYQMTSTIRMAGAGGLFVTEAVVNAKPSGATVMLVVQ